MAAINYNINKGINRPVEFRGLKAQYIYYLAIGLAILLVSFAIMYIAGMPVLLCVAIIAASGSGLFFTVFRYSHKYGEHGLSKALAFRGVPTAIVCRSRSVFFSLGQPSKKNRI